MLNNVHFVVCVPQYSLDVWRGNFKGRVLLFFSMIPSCAKWMIKTISLQILYSLIVGFSGWSSFSVSFWVFLPLLYYVKSYFTTPGVRSVVSLFKWPVKNLCTWDSGGLWHYVGQELSELRQKDTSNRVNTSFHIHAFYWNNIINNQHQHFN